MKKSVLLVLVPLLSSLASCGENSYTYVKFNLNYEGATSFTQVVNDGENVLLPPEPERVDYVFNGWYIDSECTQGFAGFNDEVEEDLELYASWLEYDKVADDIKLERLLNKLDPITGNVSETEVVMEGRVAYPVITDQVLSLYEEDVYNRYQDITTLDCYDKDKSYKFASEQFYYDDNNFYDLYLDIEGNGKNNTKKTAKFDESKVESFLSIDLLNLYCGDMYTLLSEIRNGHNYHEFDYILDFNDTRLNKYELNYTFKYETYRSKITNDSELFEEVAMFECTIQFVNGLIRRSNINQAYMMLLSGQQQMIYEYNIVSTYSNVDEYDVFMGERFDLTEFD